MINIELMNSARSQLEKLEAKSRYMSDAHAKAQVRWTALHYSLSVPLVLLAALNGLAAFKEIFTNNNTVIGWMSITIAALSATVMFLQPTTKARNHYTASVEYEALKNRARHTRTVELFLFNSAPDLSKRVEGLLGEKEQIDKRSPEVRQLSSRTLRAMKTLRSLIYGSRLSRRR